MVNVSVFKRPFAPRPHRSVSLNAVLKAIENGTFSEIEKSRLPLFTPSCSLDPGERRLNHNGIRNHTGLVVVDVDKIDNPQEHKEYYLSEHLLAANILAMFTSPSGNGLKILVPLNVTPVTQEEHREAWRQVSSHFTNVDPSGKDVVRLCYIPSDPEIYHNPNAEPFVVEEVERVETNTSAIPPIVWEDQDSIIETIFAQPGVDEYQAWLETAIGIQNAIERGEIELTMEEGKQAWMQWSTLADRPATIAQMNRKWAEARSSGYRGPQLGWGTLVQRSKNR